MLRVLLVDDDTRVLDGLRRSLWGMRAEWQMQFANSGVEALRMLENERADVVVSDMRMPGMDGAELLGAVKSRYPEAVRLILSGQANPELILRANGTAHQYLAKPCDASVLKAAIARSQGLRALLGNEQLAQLVGGVDALPSPPKAYQELLEQLQDPNSSMASVAQLISRDAALTANILKLTNSAFFGSRGPVASVERAVEFIGIDTIAALVLGYGLYGANTPVALPGFDLDALSQHSFETAAWARCVARSERMDPTLVEAAFLAGVLHDVGCAVIALRAAPGAAAPSAAAPGAGETAGGDWITASHALIDQYHAQIGAYLLGLWGFSDTVVEAIAWHHTPSRASEQSFGLCGVVHVADCLAHERHDRGSGQPPRSLEPGYLEGLGLSDRYGEWQASLPEA
jgi:HD-like signal output (HDOD) protein/ActR/RegA family two-component response regulator